MCLSNNFYPLVKLEDGKRKVLFNYCIHVKDRETFLDLNFMSKELKAAKYGSSYYQSLNLVFKREKIIDIEKMIQVPCGHCRECMNDISRQWAFRIMQEASQYDNNYFITLTYDEDSCPNFLIEDEIRKFNKKLKTYLDRKGLNSEFRFYGVGEYGSKGARPHYHVIYFNLDIPDLKFECTDRRGFLHFSSSFISNCWNKGLIDIGSVDVGSACYVARYCDKKRRLSKTEKEELESKGIVPEFSNMSRRPGIGANYYDTAVADFKKGIYRHFIHGTSFKLPLYYCKKIKDLLEGTEELQKYEEQAKLALSSLVAQQLSLSDNCDLENYLKEKDVLTKRTL